MSRTQFLQLPDAYSQALIDSLTRQPLRYRARPRPPSPTRVAALVVALLLLTLALPTKQAVAADAAGVSADLRMAEDAVANVVPDRFVEGRHL